jgi:hypothetical protein
VGRDPGSRTWTFSSTGDRRAAWWNRRLAVEVAIHRWDAEHASAASAGPAPHPLDSDVAAAGIEEFLTEFLPGLLSRQAAGEFSGTLQLHAADGPAEWLVDLGAAVPGNARADTAIRGTCSDLLLWLTNRSPPDSLDVTSRPEISDSWRKLRR